MSWTGSPSDARGSDGGSRASCERRRCRWTSPAAHAGTGGLVGYSWDGYWCLVFRLRFLVNLSVKRSVKVASKIYCRQKIGKVPSTVATVATTLLASLSLFG